MQNQFYDSILVNESPFENELINLGLVFDFEPFFFDLGYAVVVKNKY